MQFNIRSPGGPIEIVPARFVDDRGYFSETFRSDRLSEHVGQHHFVQDNQSLSKHPGTIRGPHFQTDPFVQGKLVSCLTGSLFDVAIDLRGDSATYGEWIAVTLVSRTGNQLWIPPGFAHGFCTLEPDTIVSYKVTAYYSSGHDRGVAWDDPDFAIAWPDVAEPETLSAKDRAQPAFADLPGYSRCGQAGDAHPGHRRRRIHRIGAGTASGARTRLRAPQRRCLDLCRQPGVAARGRGAPGYRFVRADICDAAAMTAALVDFRPDRIMHLAAESHVDRSITGAADFVQTNVIGTFTLLEAARGYWSGLDAGARDRFLHVSTDEVYGSLGDEGLFEETTSYDPSSPYSASKAASDHLAKAWHRTYGLPVVVSNCSNNYGPYHFPEKLIPLTILNALAGQRLPVYGKGENVRDWLYVEDHARALDLIAERERIGETYNVGERNERRNIDVVRRICAMLDRLAPAEAPYADLIDFVTDRLGHDARYTIDATKLETELGWHAEEDFDSGIERTTRWYLDHAWGRQPLRDRYEGERLGLIVDEKP